MAQNEGRIDEALDLYRRAVEQDPLSQGSYTRLGITYLAAGRQRIQTHAGLALVLLAHGRLDEACEEAKPESELAYRLLTLTAIHHAQERPQDSEEALRTLIGKESSSAAFQIAEAYAARGEVDAAFRLERAHAHRDPDLAEIKPSRLEPHHFQQCPPPRVPVYGAQEARGL